MKEIRTEIAENNKNQSKLTVENLITFASNSVQEKIKKILLEDSKRANNLRYLQSLDLNESLKPSLSPESELEKELRMANESVHIQTYDEIKTSKPAFIRRLVLKIRNLLQNEVRFSLNPIVDRQTQFNVHTIRTLNEMNQKQNESTLKQNEITLKQNEISIKLNEITLKQDEILPEQDEIALKQDAILFKQDETELQLAKTLIRLEISRAYSELLKREPTRNEVDKWLKEIGTDKLDNLNILRGKIKKSTEYYNIQEDQNNQDLLLVKKFKDRKEYFEALEKERKNKNPHALSFVDFKKIIGKNTNPFVERHTEYLWALKNLPTKGNLLDVGCLDSEFANELTKIKSLHVYGVDIRSTEENLLFQFSQDDACNLSFNDNYFDMITIISSIEHFGMDIYGSEIRDDADKVAIMEIARVLKPSGLLFLTVPFGKYSKSWSRVYNTKSLKALLEDFKILEEKYFEQTDFGWLETTKKIAETNEGAKFRKEEESSGAIACILAKKK